MKHLNLILFALVVVLAILPFFVVRTPAGTEPFAGADGQAQALIDQAHPQYKPWFHAFWTPPSKEIESLLFALQAAAGAGILGYYIGLRKGKAAAAKMVQ